MKRLLLFLSVYCGLVNAVSVFAQEPCKVLLPEIAANYDGPCKKGKAEGPGTASGTDKYSGNFKDGLPSGKGVYQWQNGDIYDGYLLKGKMDGNGTMTYKRSGKADSVVTGFWKKDEFVGKYERPFIIHSQSSQITRIEVLKGSDDDESTITVELLNSEEGLPRPVSIIQKTILTDITVASGSYDKKVSLNEVNRGVAFKLLDVVFPFKARYKVGNLEMVIEIMEPGDWLINVYQNN